MKITLLGTGSPIPDPRRAGPSTLVQTDGACLLVDAGRGVLMRLAAAGVLPPMLHGVLVTHLHSDHITDLNDVITTHWVMAPQGFVLRIVGPPRTKEVVDAILASLAPDLQYRLDHHADLTWTPNVEVTEVAPGDVFTMGSATITVGATDHRPVEPTVAFRVDDGGKSVVLGGDGVPCAGLDALCANADAYVQTVIRDDLVKLIPNARIQDILDYHSSVEQAGQTAARAGVRTLVLTHYVPSMQPGQEDDWRSRAAAHFSGDIVLGDDLTSVTF
jgi:ribonuclease Z